jgi:hypothetical protein
VNDVENLGCESAKGWLRPLSRTTTITIADSDIGAAHKKPWNIFFAQKGDLPLVGTNLPGRHFLLSQREVCNLVQHLLDSGLLTLDFEKQKVFISRLVEEDRATAIARVKAANKRSRAKRKGKRDRSYGR